MKFGAACALASVLGLAAAGCEESSSNAVESDAGQMDAGSASGSAHDAGINTAPRLYQSTASVGDFIQITLDKQAKTVSYTNRTNGLSASNVPYTVDATGMYLFAGDPNGHLQRALELEDYVLLVDVEKAGPMRDSRALAIGALAQPIALSDLADRSMNMMQFRTSNGGMEVGNLQLTVSASMLNVALQSYWPLGALSQQNDAFHVGGGPGQLPIDDAGMGPADFLTVSETDNGITEHDYIFKTAGGFAVDMSNGNIIMVAQTVSKEFDPSHAGRYHAMLYQKHDARGVSRGETEPGTAEVVEADVTIGDHGHLTVSHAGVQVEEADLIPVADAPYLTGTGKLDPARCNGIFTYRKPAGSSFQDVFVIFAERGMLVTSFTPHAQDAPDGGGGGESYEYFYGAAIKQ